MRFATFKRLLESLGCRLRTMAGEDVNNVGGCLHLWFDFPAHVRKRRQARNFAAAIRLLLPASCLMHADTEEVFGCQIVRVGADEVVRMLEEQDARRRQEDDGPTLEEVQAAAKSNADHVGKLAVSKKGVPLSRCIDCGGLAGINRLRCPNCEDLAAKAEQN